MELDVGGLAAPLAGGSIIDATGYRVAFLVALGITLVGLGLAQRAPEPNPG